MQWGRECEDFRECFDWIDGGVVGKVDSCVKRGRRYIDKSEGEVDDC